MSSFPANARALLIGVGDYLNPRFASLPATVRDAQAIAALLTDSNRCGYLTTNVELLTGEKATVASIRTALQGLAKATTDSTVFLFFSGHGGRMPENGIWRSYLCPREADPSFLSRTAIPGEEFSALLAAIPAQRLLVMLDACHAAGSADLKASDESPVWKAGFPDEYYESLSLGSGRVIIASSKETQYSYIRRQGDLSLFTYHLCEALGGKAAVRGDGQIHVLDVFHHVNEAVQGDQPSQTPILKVKDMDLNFAIALDRGGKSVGVSQSTSPIAAIRELIVKDPVAGALELSLLLASHTEWADKRTKVDLRRSELEQIQQNLDLFGPDPAEKAAKNRVVYSLLSVCVELERGGQ